MTICEYAVANRLEPDTALAHVVLFNLVEASNHDEQWQRRTFQTLLDAVDVPKFVASVREIAEELATPASARNPEGESLTDMFDDARPRIRAAYAMVYEAHRFGRELNRADWQALHEQLEDALESLDDEPGGVREKVDQGDFVAAVCDTLEMRNGGGSSGGDEEKIALLHEGKEGMGFWGVVQLPDGMKDDIPTLYQRWREKDEEEEDDFADWLCKHHGCKHVACGFARFADWDEELDNETQADPFQWWRDDDD